MSLPPPRAWFLVLLTSVCLLILFYALFGRSGLFIGLAVTLLWNYTLLFHHHRDSIEYFQGKLIGGRDPWHLNETLLAYCEKLRCPPLKLYLSPNKHPLLLVSTSDWGKPTLLMSQGLIDILSENERTAIVALGISTAKYRQTFLRYMLNRIALSWMTLGSLINNFLPFRDLQVPSHLIYRLAWLHLKCAYPQSLQAKADLEAFQATPHPRDLATALWKINGNLDTKPLPIPKPFLHQSLLGHPKSRRSAFQFILPIELRLQFLVGYFPI